MNIIRKPLSAILCALILLGAFSVCVGAYSTDHIQSSVLVRKVTGKTGDCSYEYLVANGKLFINGNGAMADYSDSNKAPWIKEYNTHTLVSIYDGVTYIGTCAFKGSSNLNELIIGNTVNAIGEKAFYNCPKLTSVTIPDSVTQIGEKALGYIDQNGFARKVSGFTISANYDSVARQYAEQNGFNFVSLNGIPETVATTEFETATETVTEAVTQPPTEPEIELESSGYSLWVGSTAVNSSNASSITGNGLSGNISYDPETSTLTLDNATIESFPKNHNTSDNNPYYSGIYSGKDITIRLIGENTVKESSSFSPSSDYYTIYGIASATGSLNFSGSGKLTTDGIDAPYIRIGSDASVNSNSKFTSTVSTGGLVASTVTKRNSRAVNTSTLIVDGTLQASQGGMYGEVPAITAKNIAVSENASLTVGLTTTYLNVSTIRNFYAKAAKAIELTDEMYIGGLLITVANCTAPTYDFDVNEPVKTGYGIFGSNANIVIGKKGTLVAEGNKRALYGVDFSFEEGEYVKRAGASERDAVDVEIEEIDGQSFVSIEALYNPETTASATEEPTETVTDTPTDPTDETTTQPVTDGTEPETNPETAQTTAATEPTTSADTHIFKFLPDNNDADNFKLVIQDTKNNLYTYDMVPTGETIDGKPVYASEVEIDYDVTLVQFQMYDGETWIGQVVKTAAEIDDIEGKTVSGDGTIVNKPEDDTIEPSEESGTSEPKSAETEKSSQSETTSPVTESTEPMTETVEPTTDKPTAPQSTNPVTKPEEPEIKSLENGASTIQTERFITAIKNEKDPKGSTFSLLCAKQKKVAKNSITIAWNRVNGAKSYVVYGAKCGSKYKKIVTVKASKFTQKKLKKNTYYKYLIVAFDKNEKSLTVSKTLHIATLGGKNGNAKSVSSKPSSLKLRVKKSKTLKITVKKASKKAKIKNHRKTAFESSDKKIAVVNSKGKVTAKKKGVCYIYAYAQNGIYKKIKVTVKK